MPPNLQEPWPTKITVTHNSGPTGGWTGSDKYHSEEPGVPRTTHTQWRGSVCTAGGCIICKGFAKKEHMTNPPLEMKPAPLQHQLLLPSRVSSLGLTGQQLVAELTTLHCHPRGMCALLSGAGSPSRHKCLPGFSLPLQRRAQLPHVASPQDAPEGNS